MTIHGSSPRWRPQVVEHKMSRQDVLREDLKRMKEEPTRYINAMGEAVYTARVAELEKELQRG